VNIISFDTCGQTLSLCAKVADKPFYRMVPDSHNRQSELLMTELEALCRQAGMSLAHFDFLAVSTGPGSFTGLRVGIAAALGIIAASPNITGIGVSVLEAKAWKFFKENSGAASVIITQKTARSQTIFQEFNNLMRPLCQPSHTNDIIHTDYTDSIISAQEIMELAEYKISNHHTLTPPEPLYVFEPDAKFNPRSGTM